MIKKLLKGAILAGSMLAMVGTASAAPDSCDCAINLYGASAQFKYWTSAAPGLLQSFGCNPADIYTSEGECFDRDAGLAVCAGTNPIQGLTGGGLGGLTFCIRYTTNASYDGIYSVSNQNPLGQDQAQCEAGVGSQAGDLFGSPCTTPWEGYRLCADETAVPLQPFAGGPGTFDGDAFCACRDIHLGASDVEAAAFQQASNGDLKGPCGGDPESRSIFNVDSYLCPGYRFARPLIVPFVFFRNVNSGNEVPFNNMTDTMAAAIFSGSVTNWNDFGPAVPSLPIKACLRHAGSGTHATLYASILYHQGASLATTQLGPTHPLVLAGLAPETYFNKGSSDEARCVGGSSCYDASGAVGYADADKNVGAGHTKYGPLERMLWNGYGCTSEDCAGGGTPSGIPFVDAETTYKDAITHGRYTFWADQHLYSCPWDFSTGIDPECYPACGSTDWVQAMTDYAAVAANVPSSRAPFWAAQAEMQVTRANAFATQSFK